MTLLRLDAAGVTRAERDHLLRGGLGRARAQEWRAPRAGGGDGDLQQRAAEGKSARRRVGCGADELGGAAADDPRGGVAIYLLEFGYPYRLVSLPTRTFGFEPFSLVTHLFHYLEGHYLPTPIFKQAYCLMGIFDINMPMLSGECAKAFLRRQEKIMVQTQDASLFAWCASEEAAAGVLYSGLLASSSSEFADCADIMHFGVDAGGVTTLLGNGQVSLRCTLQPRGDRWAVLGLQCFRGPLSKVVGIEAVQVGPNDFLKTSCSRLITCSIRSFQSVVMERYAFKTDGNQAGGVYRRDGIYLSDLPDGIALEVILPEEAGLPNKRAISVVDGIGKKHAFELAVDSDFSSVHILPVASGANLGYDSCWRNPGRVEGHEVIYCDVGLAINEERRATMLNIETVWWMRSGV